MADRLGPYTLKRLIGAGGMADVFLAVGPAGTCVVKRPHPHLLANPDFVRMFLDEAALLAQLHHPGIAQIHDLGRDRGVFYLAMEYVPGFDLMTISLEHERTGELMAPELCARIVADVADALHYAHEARGPAGQPLNIIHRDVSPHNVLLSTSGVVKLIDFGVARASNTMHRTQAGFVKGKYPYMAPEQITGQLIDRRVDVYALGLVLYELLTNARAIAGDTEVEQIDNARYCRIRPVEQLRPNTPLPLRQILMSCLYPDPEGRYPTALAVKEDLEKYLVYEQRVAGREDLLRLFRVVAAELPPPPEEVDLEAHPTEPEQPVTGDPLVLPEAGSSDDPELVGGLKTTPSARVRAAAIQLKDMVTPSQAVTPVEGSEAIPPPPGRPVPGYPPVQLDSTLVRPKGPPAENAARTLPENSGGPTSPGPEPGPRRWLPVGLLGLLAVALLAVLVTTLARGPSGATGPAGPTSAGEASVDAGEAPVDAVVMAVVDAGEATEPAVAEVPEGDDAGEASAAPDAGEGGVPGEAGAMATLEIRSTPAGTISVDRAAVGASPVTVEVAAGRHEVTVVNAAERFRKSTTVVVEPGQSRRVNLVGKKGTLEITAQPFATMTIDGLSLGTATFKTVQLYEGSYTLLLELADSTLPRPIRKQQKVQVRPGQTQQVSVVMTAP